MICDILNHSQKNFVIEIKPISWSCPDRIFFKNVYANPILIRRNRKYPEDIQSWSCPCSPLLRVLHETRRLLNRIQPYYKNDRQRKRCKRHFADVSVNPATIISASFAIANAFIEYPDDRGEVPLRHSLMLHVVPFPVKPALQSHLCENCRGKTCYFTYMLECARMEK